jgi:hypothetical protein
MHRKWKKGKKDDEFYREDDDVCICWKTACNITYSLCFAVKFLLYHASFNTCSCLQHSFGNNLRKEWKNFQFRQKAQRNVCYHIAASST